MFSDLRSFLDQLRRSGDLVEIAAPVDPALEAAEIHRRVIAAGGPAPWRRHLGTGLHRVGERVLDRARGGM